MTAASRFTVTPGIVSADVDGETVVLDASSGTYYGLNQTATRLWELIGAGEPIGRAHAALAAEYDVAPGVLWTDVKRVVLEMLSCGLVSIDAVPGVPEAQEGAGE